jgi:tRNA (guanine-N7-)-methyltransferase
MGRSVIVEAPALRLDPERVLEQVDWEAVFGAPGPVEIEVGIGKGRFLLAAAEARPEVRHLGVEWANKYLRIAESRAAKRGLENVRFVRVDVAELMPVLPEHSVSAYYVFYPDPWPKKRHQKRRFFCPANVDHLARTLVSGGLVHAATDHRAYWEVIEPLMDGHLAFERLDGFGGDAFPLPVDAPLTNFETKYAVAGRERFRASWRRRIC